MKLNDATRENTKYRKEYRCDRVMSCQLLGKLFFFSKTTSFDECLRLSIPPFQNVRQMTDVSRE